MSKIQDVVRKIRVANHFEYQGALTRKELFFDRAQELETALVVCEQIVRGRIGGIAVLGGRGSGKSSFLDALRRELISRKIPNARISLDEGMVREGNENLFIKSILEDLVKASETSGLLETKLAHKILDVLGGFAQIEEIGVDFMGLGIIAKTSKEKPGLQFPYTVLRDGLKDFLRIVSEKGSTKTAHGAILLLDEGDALTINRNLLQILRNVLQETPGIGLVIAGSSGLLSQVGSVLSPLPRFFRKIELGPYPSDDIVYDAIAGPLDLSRKELLDSGLDLTFVHSQFDRIVTQISGRMPMEINMLCYFAIDLGASRVDLRENTKFTVFLQANKELFDQAMKQMGGTKEYATLIAELEKTEISCLVLLSKSMESSTVDEITVLMGLHELGDRLQESSVLDVVKRVEASVNERQKIITLLASVNAKGQEYKISMLSSSLMGKPRFSIEDQWIRAYFKYGWSDIDVDLELGLKPFGGIRVFGDPVASIVHSFFFPKFAGCLGPRDSFRAHTRADTGSYLVAAKGCKVLNVTYVRIATNSPYHIAFHLKQNAGVEAFKRAVEILMDGIKKAGLVDSYAVIIR